MTILPIKTRYYQHFDADFSLEYPAEGYGGWKEAVLEYDFEHTAFVVMHTWDCGSREQYPGWHRVVEYIPRADQISEGRLPDFLELARKAGMTIIHIVGHSGYYENYPGYQKVLSWAGDEPEPPQRIDTSSLKELHAFRHANVAPGTHNQKDITAGQARLDFSPKLKPQGEEYIAATSHQLFSACEKLNLQHLIYTGFAINGCLWTSPGGMIDMSRRGILCSIIEELTTAIENRESVREEKNKANALWATAIFYGFVFQVDDVISALETV